MMRRWAIQFWQGSGRAVLEVSAETYDDALHQARLDADALIVRLQYWLGRRNHDEAKIYETAQGAAIYNDWGPDGYRGQPYSDERIK